jgi:hypothetical protein
MLDAVMIPLDDSKEVSVASTLYKSISPLEDDSKRLLRFPPVTDNSP